MKKIKLILTTLSIVLALSVFTPVQIVRADDGVGPQGGTDSQSRQTQSSTEEAARAFWAWVAKQMGW